MSQTIQHTDDRKKQVLALALLVVLLVSGACQQSKRFASDPRYTLPGGVTYDELDRDESFRMPKQYAGTTVPDHWRDVPPTPMGNSTAPGAACPCCSGEVRRYVSAESPVPSTGPSSMTSQNTVASGQPTQFLIPASRVPAAAPQLNSSIPAASPPAVNATMPDVPNGKFSDNTLELRKRERAGMIIRAQSPQTEDIAGFDLDTEGDIWGSDVFGGGTETDGTGNGGAKTDAAPTPTVTAPKSVVVTPRPTDQEKAAEADRERQRRQEAALKARPTADDGIHITFDRGQKRPVTVDPALKQAGESIISNPQVYNEYRNPGGFQFRNIYGAWPQDEYLVDGGDDGVKAYVRGNWEIRGLEPEDTIAHYDTIDNRRLVEKSNRVHIYSPRFGSVRKIDGASAAIEWQHYAGAESRTKVAASKSRMKTGRTEQNATADYARTNVLLRSANAGANTGTVGLRTSPTTYRNEEVVASLSQLLTHATFSNSELAYLAEAKRAAVAWGGLDRVEVQVGERTAQAMIGLKTPESVYILGEPETSPKLRLFKVASKETAQRGEIVEFMIRFDNVGSEVVGNVTIADSLTTRLEYIDGSAGSSVPAEFFVEPNDAGSHVLRWEIAEPLHAGDFGVVRFRCRVQ